MSPRNRTASMIRPKQSMMVLHRFLGCILFFLILGNLHSDILTSKSSDDWVIVDPQYSSTLQPLVEIHTFKGSEYSQGVSTKIQGSLASAYFIGADLRLIFRQSIYDVNLSSGEQKNVYRAPQGIELLTMFCTASGNGYLLRGGQQREKFTILLDDENHIPLELPELSKSRQDFRIASENHFAITNLDQIEDVPQVVYIISLKGNQAEVKKISSLPFPTGALAFREDELVLFPKTGQQAMSWDGADYSPLNLPSQDPPEAFISMGFIENNYLFLSQSKTGKTVHFPSGDTLKLATGNGEEKFVSDNLEQHLHVLILILVTLSLLVRLNRRRQLNEEVKVTELPLKPAPLLTRSFAFLIDYFLVDIIVSIISLSIYGSRILIINPAMSNADQLILILSENIDMFLTIVIIRNIFFICYQTIMLRFFGGSFGKSILRLKCVNEDGSDITTQQALIKYACFSIDLLLYIPLGLIFCLTSKKGQSFGDRMAKVMVIRER
ncbi:MAG: RDD family protein [Planctomycetes bacterium]|nr:RDD family protein [Planctomycetota bacterium]